LDGNVLDSRFVSKIFCSFRMLDNKLQKLSTPKNEVLSNILPNTLICKHAHMHVRAYTHRYPYIYVHTTMTIAMGLNSDYRSLCLLDLLNVPEDGGSTFLWNVGKLLPNYTAPHLRKWYISFKQLRYRSNIETYMINKRIFLYHMSNMKCPLANKVHICDHYKCFMCT
jgi:hypothetical protein